MAKPKCPRDFVPFKFGPAHLLALHTVFGTAVTRMVRKKTTFFTNHLNGKAATFLDNNEKVKVFYSPEVTTRQLVHEFAHAWCCVVWPETMEVVPQDRAEAVAIFCEALYSGLYKMKPRDLEHLASEIIHGGRTGRNPEAIPKWAE